MNIHNDVNEQIEKIHSGKMEKFGSANFNNRRKWNDNNFDGW